MVLKRRIVTLLVLTVIGFLGEIICSHQGMSSSQGNFSSQSNLLKESLKGWVIPPNPILELISEASQDGLEGLERVDKVCSAKKWKTFLLIGEIIDDELAVHIANFLANSKSFTAVVLNNNALSPQGISHILGGIKKNDHLERLRIMGSHIGDEGLNGVAELLKRNTCLKELMLVGVGPLSSTAMEHFAQALMNNHTLEELTFESLATLLFPILLKGLNGNNSIKIITISSGEINDHSMKLLSGLLKDHQYIEEINVTGKDFGGGNLESFMSALAKNKTLKRLTLWVPLSPQDIIYLSDALKENTTIETLSFHSSLTENNDCLKILANGLSNNQGLKSLDISGTRKLRVEWETLRELVTRNNNKLTLEF